jgi:HEPN domain-containing protein
MSNKSYALEWFVIAQRNLETAQLLHQANHYTDVIAIDLHQALEKGLKAIYAFNGVSIPRTHSLPLLFDFVCQWVDLSAIPIEKIIAISDYYESDRYPGPKYFMPSADEISQNIILTASILELIKKHID